MNRKGIILLLLVVGVLLGCKKFSSESNTLHIRSDFERGSMGVLKQVGPGHFKGQTMHFIKKNQNGNQCYWFYFNVINGDEQEITIDLTNLEGIYRGGPHLVYTDYTQPVISNDKQSWDRIQNVKYNESERSFTFSFTPSADTAWVAYAHPYAYGRLNQMLDTLENSALVDIETIGKSVDGRDMKMVKIAREDTDNPKNVFITGMQHAGEDAGGYMMEGVIEYLLSGMAGADSLLQKANFYMVPMMNPDGIFYGVSRYNWNMEDLNSDWDDGWVDTTDMTTEPEVTAVKRWTQNFLQKRKIDLFLDIHNHTQKNRRNVFVYPDPEFRDFVEINNGLWEVGGVNSDFEGSVVWYMEEKYNIPAATIELTQSHTGDGDYLNIEDYHNYGQGLARAIHQYFP